MGPSAASGASLDWIGVGIPFVASLCYIALTALVLAYGRGSRVTRAFSVLLLAYTLWSLGSMFWHLTAGLFWNNVLATGVTLGFVALANFISEFLGFKNRLPVHLAMLFSLIMVVCIWTGYVTADSYMEQGVARMSLGPAFPFLMAGGEAIYLWSLWQLVRRYRDPGDRTFRHKLQYLILATALIAVAGLVNAIPGIGHLPIDVAISVIYASLIAYAILRHQLLDITVVIRRGVGYSIFTVGIATAYLFSVFALQRIFSLFLGPSAYIHLCSDSDCLCCPL
jgi:hypothetical protein